MDKILLTKEKETLLIPLFGKAKESSKKSPILVDKKAVEIVDQIDYDFKSLKIPEKTNIMMSIRAKLIDDFVKDFLSKNNDSAALHLGCGLDSRYDRIGNSSVDWYDVDFKEVIDIRKCFYKETEQYHLVPSSVTEDEWINTIPAGKKQCIVIAEGLFMYLKKDDIKKLIKNLADRVGSFTLVFDAFSSFTVKKMKYHPSLKKTGAVIHWGIDHPEEFTVYDSKIEFIKEKYFTSNEAIERLNMGFKAGFKIANLFSAARNAHRLFIYKVG